MFDDEPVSPRPDAVFPRNLENMSVNELEVYIKDLQAEIARVQTNIAGKKASQEAAAAVFKD